MRAADPADAALAPSWAGPILGAQERRALQALVHRETGITLSDAKHQLITSRLSGRLRQLGLASFRAYLDLLDNRDPGGAELRELIDRITTNKTSFFREPHHFEFLRERLGHVQSPRVWSAACSSGEEPYSIAMTLAEAGVNGHEPILASDISSRVLRHAEAGIYDSSRLEGLPTASLRRHFLRGRGSRTGSYCVHPDVRRRVEFRRINLIGDWDHRGPFDIIFCRNTLIYFGREVQDRLLRRFAEMLSPGGHLILGHSENLAWLGELFEPVGQTVYRLRNGRRDAPARVSRPPLADVRIIVGQVAASRAPQVISTVLGSCVAACLYDPVARIGGMNHFMLPDGGSPMLSPSRYGVHAMELLINEIMKLGGDRRRLQAKVFGAASSPVLGLSVQRVAETNAEFIRAFLATEGILLVKELLGGERPMEVRMETATGKVLARRLDVTRFTDVPLAPAPAMTPSGDVTLF